MADSPGYPEIYENIIFNCIFMYKINRNIQLKVHHCWNHKSKISTAASLIGIESHGDLKF